MNIVFTDKFHIAAAGRYNGRPVAVYVTKVGEQTLQQRMI